MTLIESKETTLKGIYLFFNDVYRLPCRLFVIAALVIVTFSEGYANVNSDGTEKISQPFHYGGYTQAEYMDYERLVTYVPLSDGAKLAADIYLPKAQSPKKFPAIVWYLPGHRESINPETGETSSQSYGGARQFFTSYGYAYLVVEMRGSGASTGSRFDRGPQIGIDGKELIDWIAKQSWSDGKVGMVGASYQGFSQYATASQKPEALKAIFPEIAGFDEYSVMFYPGGVQNIAMSNFATGNIAKDDRNYYLPATKQNPRPSLPSVPVIDEDQDGELADEIPLDVNGNGSFLDDGPPQYPDGAGRDNIYYNATLSHTKNTNLTASVIANAPYRDSLIPESDYSYFDLGPGSRPLEIANSGIAVYNRGGWFDYHARDATLWTGTLMGKTFVKMTMPPSIHGGFPGRMPSGPYWDYFGVQENGTSLNLEKLRFFDRYLKGIENGIDREPPIYIYVMGKGWRYEDHWPIQRNSEIRFYFDDNNSLTSEPAVQGSDNYDVDLSADSRDRGANRWNFLLFNLKTPMQGTDQDKKRLTYTSRELTQDMEITGHPIVNLWVSSTADDGDIFVYLEDVDDKGNALFISDGVLRANFAEIVPGNDILKSELMEIKPDLPWHGFKSTDYVDKIFANQNRVNLIIDLMPTSWVFKKGHRVRLSIAGADWPTFQLHPKLSPANNPSDPNNVSPTLTIYRGNRYPSFISLPLTPNSPTSYAGILLTQKEATPAKLYVFKNTVYLSADGQWKKWQVYDRQQNKNEERIRAENDQGELSLFIKQNSPNNYIVTAQGDGCSFEGTIDIK